MKADHKPPLRVGLLVDSFIQPRWIEKIIRDIQSSAFAEVCLVIKNESEEPPLPRLRAYWKNRNHLLYAFYSQLDNRLVKPSPDAFEPVDIRELVSICPASAAV